MNTEFAQKIRYEEVIKGHLTHLYIIEEDLEYFSQTKIIPYFFQIFDCVSNIDNYGSRKSEECGKYFF